MHDIELLSNIRIRPIHRGDFARLAAIDAGATRRPWDEKHFGAMLDAHKVVLAVDLELDVRATTIGFVAFESQIATLDFLRLVIDRQFQRRGLGRVLVNKVIGMEGDGRTFARVFVPEDWKDAQLFFHSQSFKCVESLARPRGPKSLLFLRKLPATSPRRARTRKGS